jgi:hypothetical protein
MPRLTRNRTWRVPHGLAVAAAFMLLASTLAGVSGLTGAPNGAGTQLSSLQTADTERRADAEDGIAQKANRSAGKFKARLLLFRR